MRLSWKHKDDPTTYVITSEEIIREALCAYRDTIIMNEEGTSLERAIRLSMLDDLIRDATLRHAVAVRGGA